MRCEVAQRGLPRDGERVSGDAVFVRSVEAVTWLAVVDALGHGEGAAATANLALEALAARPPAERIETCVDSLHQALRGTRGAAALLLRVETERGSARAHVRGCSVGNVELRSCHTRIPMVMSAGVLGVRLPRTRFFEAELCGPQRLVAYTDGISSRFSMDELTARDLTAGCKWLLEACRRSHDDAMVAILDLRDE
jgi:phosphoserine phosphatase RsbX